jgi:hypothetical protein
MSCANTETVAAAEKTVSVEPSAAGLYLGYGIAKQGSFAVNGKKGPPAVSYINLAPFCWKFLSINFSIYNPQENLYSPFFRQLRFFSFLNQSHEVEARL